jgi:formiminotetrahydrofolate cyclodeaminase
MQYAPENMDRAYNYSYNQYEDKVEKIIEKYTPIAEKFNELLKTDA